MTGTRRDYVEVVYDESARPLTDYPARLTRYLSGRLGIRQGDRLLEMGCGRGEFLDGFERCGIECYGVDEANSAGKRSAGASVSRCDIENENLPFENDFFDVVFSKSVIEHLRNPDRLLSEAMRVLRPGGFIVTMTPDWEIMYRIFFDAYTHRTPFTRASLREAHLINGFDDVHVERFRQLPVLWSPAGRWLLPAAEATRMAAPRFLKPMSKWVRFSKEVMLLSTARRPANRARGTDPARLGDTSR